MQISNIINLQSGKGRFFCRKMFHKVFWMTNLASLGLVAANIMDAVVVGRQMGASGLAAIGMVSPIYVLYNILGYGFSVGGAVTFSKLMGKGKDEAAVSHFNQILLLSVLVSAFIGIAGNLLLTPIVHLLGGAAADAAVIKMCKDYASLILWTFPIFMINFVFYEFVRCDDDQRIASISYVIGCLSDVALNWILVVGLDIGVQGAAWATVIGQFVSVLILTTHFFKPGYHLHMALSKINFAETLISFKIGLSTSSRYFFQCLYLIMMNNLLMHFAPDGNLYVAVFDVVMNVTYIGCFIYTAACETMSPLASTFNAEHNRENLIELLKTALLYGCIGSILLGIVIAVFADPVASMFGLNNALSLSAIRAYCISISFTAFVEISACFYQAIEKPKAAGIITLLRNFVILFPISAIIGIYWTQYFWYALPAEEILTALAASFVIFKAIPEKDENVFSYTLTNDQKDVSRLLSQVENYLEQSDSGIKQSYVISMVVEELCTAIIEHAFKNDPEEYIQLTITPEKTGNIVLNIRDSAVSFNPFEMQTKRLNVDSASDHAAIDAMGILMIKKKAKEFYYRRYQGFNVTTIIV